MSSDKERDIPGVIFPPPLIYLAAIVVGLGLDRWVAPPLPWPTPAMSTPTGIVLMIAAISLGAWQFLTFRRWGTPVPPYQPTTVIATDGPYRFSRNPAYLAMAFLTLGLAFCFGGWWTVVALGVALTLIRFGVIAREERYLERKFGDAYTSYKAKVRRWL